MASLTATSRRIPLPVIVIGATLLCVLIAGVVYLSRPVAKTPPPRPSPEATAYLPNLELSDVHIDAAENFMKQRVVEIKGKITNKGPRRIKHIDVNCIFSGIDGREVYRERVPIVQRSNRGTLVSGQTRPFRLAFDTLPDTWNQAMPRLVIAQIEFAD
ncbi:MAG: hypothetical protein JOZ62_19980 [Acidobacteriaceae bacterium]|nr:hypothetical protein [Acidobacteriaceae bacterium]